MTGAGQFQAPNPWIFNRQSNGNYIITNKFTSPVVGPYNVAIELDWSTTNGYVVSFPSSSTDLRQQWRLIPY